MLLLVQVSQSNALDFFDEFERQTSGIKEVSPASQVTTTQMETLLEKQVEIKEEKDELNDFFDEFERTTGGENFRSTNR